MIFFVGGWEPNWATIFNVVSGKSGEEEDNNVTAIRLEGPENPGTHYTCHVDFAPFVSGPAYVVVHDYSQVTYVFGCIKSCKRGKCLREFQSILFSKVDKFQFVLFRKIFLFFAHWLYWRTDRSPTPLMTFLNSDSSVKIMSLYVRVSVMAFM